MRIGYLACFSGISGDMMLGALVDAGVPFSLLEETVAGLGLGLRLEQKRVKRGGMMATKVDVLCPEEEQPHRSLATILKILDEAKLEGPVRQWARQAFQLLGAVEAEVHGVPIEEVHFHEVGALDTIADLVGTAAGVLSLGVNQWMSTSLNVGSGTIETAHGLLPVPAPATLKLLGTAKVVSLGKPMERVTPTGATILRMLNVYYAPLPVVSICRSGLGAGERDTDDMPNVMRLDVCESADDTATEFVAVIETDIDDANPQLISYLSDKLLDAGALDVYRTTVQMKKGRSGVQLTVLAPPDQLSALRELIFRESTSIGVRWRLESRFTLRREFVAVETRWGTVNIKVASWPNGEQANATPEFEDCRQLAAQHAVPLKRVINEALRLYEEQREREGGQQL